MAALTTDRERTAQARASGEFLCRHSRYTMDGRVFLKGEDKRLRRLEIYSRARGHCEMRISKYCIAVPGWTRGEWYHRHGRRMGDSLENALWGCRACHRLHHPHVRLATIPMPKLAWEHVGEP